VTKIDSSRYKLLQLELLVTVSVFMVGQQTALVHYDLQFILPSHSFF